MKDNKTRKRTSILYYNYIIIIYVTSFIYVQMMINVVVYIYEKYLMCLTVENYEIPKSSFFFYKK